MKLRESPSGRYVEIPDGGGGASVAFGANPPRETLDVDAQIELTHRFPHGKVALTASAGIGLQTAADNTTLDLLVYVGDSEDAIAAGRCRTAALQEPFYAAPTNVAVTVGLELAEETEIRVVLLRGPGNGDPIPLKGGELSWTAVHQAAE